MPFAMVWGVSPRPWQPAEGPGGSVQRGRLGELQYQSERSFEGCVPVPAARPSSKCSGGHAEPLTGAAPGADAEGASAPTNDGAAAARPSFL